MIETNDYPKVDGDVVTILNCYGSTADGETMELDFSEIEVEQIKQESMQCVIQKYNDRQASPLYLRVLVPAVKHFAHFAALHEMQSFSEYGDTIAEEYRDYLKDLKDEKGKTYSLKYQRYLWGVPRLLKNYLSAGEEQN